MSLIFVILPFCKIIHIQKIRNNYVFLIDERQKQGRFRFSRRFFKSNILDCNHVNVFFTNHIRIFLLFPTIITGKNNSHQGVQMAVTFGILGFFKET